MLDRITDALNFDGRALILRAERQKLIAGNIANADTPGYKAVDMDFTAALRAATGAIGPVGQSDSRQALTPARTHGGHLPVAAGRGIENSALLYRQPAQPAIDNNTVDPELERGQFADNAVRYEATLRFLSGTVRTLTQAIGGNGNG